MPFSQFRFFLLLLSLTLLCATTPAFASPNKVIDIVFIMMFLYAAVIALPSGLFCGAAELIGVLYRPPLWIGWVALGLSLPGLAIVFGMENYLLKIGRGFGARTELGNLLFMLIVPVLVYCIPALISLALVTLLPAARRRLIAMWSIAIGISWWVLFQAQPGKNPGLYPPGLIFGGVWVSMLIWQVAFALGQRRLRKIAIPSASGPQLDRLMEKES